MKLLKHVMAFSTIGVLALSVSATQAADSNMKPGLWQHQLQFTSETGEFERMMQQLREQMQAMPAAQREMMQNMMKSQGVDFDFQNQTFKTCLTPEKAAEGNLALMENNDCEETARSSSGDSTTITFACSGETRSEGTITLDGDTRYSGESSADVELQGKLQKMTVAHQGEWLDSDCGDVQPQ
ncbi:DUF3617 domain-containing protein [Gilvimarinus polysaccharolyticus]|uniref:DUF3617 domain-containing protein n=1 Tax=Gilvimarinus polysaccharolyticus TaxID=863921 RepID=UPI000673C3C2|nr:DUF3617 domain-containing protein [Gilvimarinus polysaccharolyticus]